MGKDERSGCEPPVTVVSLGDHGQGWVPAMVLIGSGLLQMVMEDPNCPLVTLSIPG